MDRKTALLNIKTASRDGGFTLLDVLPEFAGVEPSRVEHYLTMAYNLDFISLNAQNPLCMYPTQKLRDLK